MIIFFLLLSFISGLLLIRFPLFIILFIFIIIIKKSDKRLLIFLFCSFFLGITVMGVRLFLSHTPFNKGYGVVINASKNTLIILTFKGKYYIAMANNNFAIGDIIFVQGTHEKYHFRFLEEGFNYNNYLKNKGIFYALKVEKLALKIPSLLHIFHKINMTEARYPPHLENIKNLLLTKTINYDDPFISDLIKYDLLFVLSLSGAHLSFIRRFIKKISNVFLSEGRSEFLSYLLLLPLFLLQITKFAFYRIFLSGIFRFFNKNYLKSYFNSLECNTIVSFIFLFINPFLIYDPAFYLSYLLIFLFNLMRPARSFKGRLTSVFLLFIVLIPYKIISDGALNIFGIFIPLLLTPFIGIWFIIYFITLVITPLRNIGVTLLNITYNAINLINRLEIVIYFGSLNTFSVILLVILLFVLLYSVSGRIKLLTKKVIFSLIFVLTLQLLPFTNYFTYRLSFINVGQGDSTLLVVKGHALLIDTGGHTFQDISTSLLIPYLRKNKVHVLNYLIITHDDFDHSGGEKSLITNFSVKKVIREKEAFPLSFHGLTIYNLNNQGYDDPNHDSLILYFNIRNKGILLMGDAGTKNEEELMQNYTKLDVYLLKVGHHGSDTSTSSDFIARYKPEVAIISVGYQNHYGHPHQSVLETLKAQQVKIRRTDLEGTITYKFSII